MTVPDLRGGWSAWLTPAFLLFAGCGPPDVPYAPEPYLHAERQHVMPDTQPPGAPDGLAHIALPEVRYVGEAGPDAYAREPLVLVLEADGTVRLGSQTLRLPPNAWDHDALEALWPGDAATRAASAGPAPRVELYADRAARWGHVKATLSFLALPPRSFPTIWLAVASEAIPERPAYLACRPAWPRRAPRGRPDPRHGRSLPHLPRKLYEGPYAAYFGRRDLGIVWADFDEEGEEVLSSNGFGVGFFDLPSPGRLEDPEVLRRTNDLLARWDRWARAGTDPHILQLGYNRSHIESGRVAHFPLAHALAFIDLTVRAGVDVVLELPSEWPFSWGLVLHFPPAPGWRPRYDAQVPLPVALACLLAALLALATSLAPRARRAGAGRRFPRREHGG